MSVQVTVRAGLTCPQVIWKMTPAQLLWVIDDYQIICGSFCGSVNSNIDQDNCRKVSFAG